MAHWARKVNIDQGENEDWIKFGIPDVNSKGEVVLPTRNGKAIQPLAEGGAGSGHHGHAGVVGVQGGSAPGGGSPEEEAKRAANRARVAAFRAKKKAEKEAAAQAVQPPKPKTWAERRTEAARMAGSAPKLKPGERVKARNHPTDALDNAKLSLMVEQRRAALDAHDAQENHGYLDGMDYNPDKWPWKVPDNHEERVKGVADNYNRRGRLKDDICQQLSGAEDMFDPAYNEVNSTIAAWAASSGDANNQSIGAQWAATELFGVENPGWYRKDPQGELTWKRQEQETAQAKAQPIIERMYQHTQEQLEQAGVKTVRLYRGVRLRNGAPGVADLVDGDTFTFIGNPMSSWSMSPTTAKGFARAQNGFERGLMMVMDVPAERIVSTAATGYGCYNEQEVVVLGGMQDTATILLSRKG